MKTIQELADEFAQREVGDTNPRDLDRELTGLGQWLLLQTAGDSGIGEERTMANWYEDDGDAADEQGGRSAWLAAPPQTALEGSAARPYVPERHWVAVPLGPTLQLSGTLQHTCGGTVHLNGPCESICPRCGVMVGLQVRERR